MRTRSILTLALVWAATFSPLEAQRGNRTHGGGGIRPDVLLPERQAAPLWLAQVQEEDLPFRWIGGYLDANPNLLTRLD